MSQVERRYWSEASDDAEYEYDENETDSLSSRGERDELGYAHLASLWSIREAIMLGKPLSRLAVDGYEMLKWMADWLGRDCAELTSFDRRDQPAKLRLVHYYEELIHDALNGV